MNLLGLIFSILISLTIACSVLFEKQIGGARLRSTALGHLKANRTIFNKYTNKVYKTFPQDKSAKQEPRDSSQLKDKEKEVKFPTSNPECARINLWPLVHEEKEAHALLYQYAAKLLRLFYGSTLLTSNGSEHRFLDALLQALQQHPKQNALETLCFSDPADRRLYYQMVKGTKHYDLFEQSGYPPLLEYISFQQKESKPCLFHAHPYLTSIFFTPAIACNLYQTIHRAHGEKFSAKLLEKLCLDAHLLPSPALFDLVQLKSCRNPSSSEAFTGTDASTQITLRKSLPLKAPSPS